MSSFLNFLFGFILILIWIVAGGFITQASIFLTPFKDRDTEMHRAYWFAFWASFTTWSLVAIFIILIILSVIGVVALFGSGVGEAGAAAEEAEGASSLAQIRGYAGSSEGQLTISSGISWFTLAFLVFALILVGITGVLSAIAAGSMAASSHFDRSNSRLVTAYNDCIIAASLCLGAAGILLIGILVYFIIGLRQQREHNKELAEVAALRQQSIRRSILQRTESQQLQLHLQQQLQMQQLQQALAQQAGSQPVPEVTPIAPQASSLPEVTRQAVAQHLYNQFLGTSPNTSTETTHVTPQATPIAAQATSQVTHVTSTTQVPRAVPVSQAPASSPTARQVLRQHGQLLYHQFLGSPPQT